MTEGVHSSSHSHNMSISCLVSTKVSGLIIYQLDLNQIYSEVRTSLQSHGHGVVCALQLQNLTSSVAMTP